ncbi:MAG: selenium cofactor biosynthesis protein YqeC, partial [Anaerolineales bacterium]
PRYSLQVVDVILLNKALRLGAAPQVAFVGSGGKTAALFALARLFENPVLVSTSTHISVSQADQADQHLIIKQPSDLGQLDAARLPAVTVLTGEKKRDGRQAGMDEGVLSAMSNFAQEHKLPLLIEADGARLRSLKAPAWHEPAIPPFVDTVVVVAGLSALGHTIGEEYIHRPERFAQLSGQKLGDLVDSSVLARVLLHPEGGLKNIPPQARRVVLLNQADSAEMEGAAHKLSARLLSAFDAVLVTALQRSPQVLAVHEPVAGILLAAGSSLRLGRPKQLLDWKGTPFVRQVAATALAAGLNPVVVVTGSEAEKVEAALTGLDVHIQRNPDWAQGQSSSVKAGLAALPENAGAALFLVVDQPQLPVALIEALCAEHAANLAPIVAPQVDGQRSNPVLFDRNTFADFITLQGDVGGRAIFSRHPVVWLPWLDASIAIDVDKPEDYDRLLQVSGQSGSR